jgi:hypothetical protein
MSTTTNEEEAARSSMVSIGDGIALRFADLRVLDWYDGVVRAVGRLEEGSVWLYCSLLAWDVGLGLKAYALVPIGETRATDLLREAGDGSTPATQESWGRLKDAIARLLNECRGSAWVILCEDLKGEVIKWKRMGVGICLSCMADGEVDRALEPARVSRWIEGF